MVKKYYGGNPFGRPLDKKKKIDKHLEKLVGQDMRTQTENSKHNQEIFFNKVFK